MHKEIYNDLIKMFTLLLCTSNRQDKEIAIKIIGLQIHVYP